MTGNGFRRDGEVATEAWMAKSRRKPKFAVFSLSVVMRILIGISPYQVIVLTGISGSLSSTALS